MFLLALAAIPTVAPAQTALDFDGTNDYVTFGQATSLGLQTFTLECWFKREGAGVATSTGTGGITSVIPLVTKGRGEAEGGTTDMNYFLGIRSTDNVLGADFEDNATGLNHPVVGVTPIATGTWYHAAATYDGTTWRLYLNGSLEATTVVGAFTPQNLSVQHAGIATGMTTAGLAAGFFNGVIDEVRIWSVARSQAEIADALDEEITSAPNLAGHWGLNEGSGTTAANSGTASGVNGTLTNGPLWVAGSPFTLPDAIDFAGTNAYVNFGAPASLALSNFTLEMWVRRDGAGVGTNTGGGGIPDLIPLIAKGRADAETAAQDINYIFGIRASDGVLAADFEEGAGGASPSLNHPVAGSTVLTTGTWYHVAATYDGTTWKLYLNGELDVQLAVGQPAGSGSGVAMSVASALTLAGTAAGFFDGAIDEIRVWNVARTAAEINATINEKLTAPAAGLVGRWGLDEGAGTTVHSSAGTTLDGTVAGTGWGWATGAPFDIGPPSPPAAPSGLAAVASTASQVELSWIDNANNETGFEVERSTTGSGGPFSLLVTLPANTTAHADGGLEASSEYCYRVRAIGLAGPSAYSDAACATTTGAQGNALQFGSSDGYVTFGPAPSLGLAQFTIEAWFRRDGAGVSTSTGTNGLADGIPMIAKGRGESETSGLNMNYFFGIRAADGVLCADFEEGSGGTLLGDNHPVYGVTPVTTGVWYHGAVTYDGTTWTLYLDGNLETQLAVGQPPEAISTQHASLGTALNSTGVAAGHFDGTLDEVRIWNYARSQAEIFAAVNTEIVTATPGLVARWGLDDWPNSTVHGSAGTTLDGSILGTGWTWTDGAPFNIGPPSPPAAPSGLTAAALSSTQIRLDWTDNSVNEVGFSIERSTTGNGGPFSPLATVGANIETYTDGTASASNEYCYRVIATNAAGPSSPSNVACATPPVSSGNALGLGGTNAYVDFGNVLKLSQFTLEMWFRRDGTGVGTNTGSGGIPDMVPLIAKGRADADVPAQDINYIFGIRASDGVIAADFEEGAAGSSPSLNHPVAGVTPVAIGGWHHGAVTYDGTTWNLYLDGNFETQLAVGQPAGSGSDVAVSLGSALTLAGSPSGYFNGVMDEVRIWNVARTQAEIQSLANVQITTAQPGLVARWALDEGSGTAVNGSAGTAFNGTIAGTSYSWTNGAPFNLTFNQSPSPPTLVAPSDDAVDVLRPPSLTVTASDADADDLTVSFYGRPVSPAGPDFTLIGLPDTQYYTGQLNGGTAAMLNSQTQWIIDNIASRNIVYTVQLGDCVEHGDNGGDDIEWQRADAAYDPIESPVLTGLPEGMPYGICVGNHDQSPNGDAAGTTTFYNQYFGEARFLGRGYYGGHYGSNNDNWYNLFSAGGMDFISIGFEYDTAPDAAVLAWADQLLTTYSNRRAIVSSHSILGTGNPGTFSSQGSAIYNALRGHANLFLMLCGHVPGEGRRQDTFGGNTVHTLLSDYQGRTNGGNGWLRILEFSPANNVIRVRTYSPWLDQFEADADSSSQFTLSYPMSGSGPFQLIGTANIASGGTAQVSWTGLAADTEYEWYATVNDGNTTITGPTWSFRTAEGIAPAVQVLSPNGAETVTIGVSTNLTWNATDNVGVTAVDLQLSRTGSGGPFESIATGIGNTGSYAWNATGPVTTDGFLKVVAHDAATNSGEDLSDAAFSIIEQTGVEGIAITEFALSRVSPNPARGAIHMTVDVPQSAHVRIQLLDVQGRVAATLGDGVYAAGRHEISWRGVGHTPPGLYLVRMQAAGRTFMQRFLLLN